MNFDTIVNMMVYTLFHPIMMLIYGIGIHFLRKMMAAKSHGSSKSPCITDLWRDQPLQTTVSFMGAGIGYVVLVHMPDFSDLSSQVQNMVRINAFGIGFMCDSVVDAIGEKAIRNGIPLKPKPPETP